jgi:hypothetical protein
MRLTKKGFAELKKNKFALDDNMYVYKIISGSYLAQKTTTTVLTQLENPIHANSKNL